MLPAKDARRIAKPTCCAVAFARSAGMKLVASALATMMPKSTHQMSRQRLISGEVGTASRKLGRPFFAAGAGDGLPDGAEPISRFGLAEDALLFVDPILAFLP